MTRSIPLFKSLNGVGTDLQSVEACLKEAMASDVNLIPEVGVYLLGSGGKRIRPLLHLLSCRVAGYEGRDHIATASALELIHTATLLHDDVVDQAKVRRGKKAANIIWDNPTSVLVGDYLFAKSFALMLQAANPAVMRIVADVCTQMAEGEALQLTANGGRVVDRESYLEIIKNKTAILFAAACRLGAVMAEASASQEKALLAFGDALGAAFQIADDALDYKADPGQLGKAIGKDLEEGKITLPLIEALEAGTEAEREEILDHIAKFSDNHEIPAAEDLTRVTQFVDRYQGAEKAMLVAETYIEAAKRSLALFDESEAKRTMVALAEFVTQREY